MQSPDPIQTEVHALIEQMAGLWEKSRIGVKDTNNYMALHRALTRHSLTLYVACRILRAVGKRLVIEDIESEKGNGR